MRSTLGRLRVTHTVRPWASRWGRPATGTIGRPAACQATTPPSRLSAGMPWWRSQAATPWLSFRPFLQMTTAGRPVAASAGPQAGTSAQARRSAPGTR